MSRWYTRLAAVAASAITVLSFALWRSSRESTGPETLVAPTPLTNPSTTSEETFADIALSQLDALESAMKRGADGPTVKRLASTVIAARSVALGGAWKDQF